jgi:hypothetical protein
MGTTVAKATPVISGEKALHARRTAGPQTEAAYLAGPLSIQLRRRLTEKVSQESITSKPNNRAKVAKIDMRRDRLNRKPRRPAHGHRGFLVQRNHESGGIVIVCSLPERCDSGNGVNHNILQP